MRRPSPAILGSIALHAGVVALAFVTLKDAKPQELKPLVASVPVSIVSEETVQAAAADNPQPEPSPDDGATAPPPEPEPSPPQPTPTPPTPAPPTPPRPTPPTPTPPRPVPPRPAPTPTPTPRPTPTPPRPTPTPPRPTPTPTPPRPTPPTPARPQPATPTPPTKAPTTPARPAQPRPEPGLDLAALAGPPRNTSNPGRPATGQTGAGTASRAVGRGDLQSLGAQVRPPQLNCDLPGADSTLVRVAVRLNTQGRIVGTPRLQGARNPISERVIQAILASQPFTMPSGYEEQDLPFVFNTSTWC